jgi:MEMO1 family protein
MANSGAIVFSGIAPHPPIMVPEVGREAVVHVQSSITAMAEFTRRIIENGAETLLVISPHAPLDPSAFVAYRGPTLHGHFANFRAPQAAVDFSLDLELLEMLVQHSADNGYEVLVLQSHDLDHGIAVPLYFLQRNGWRGQVVALGYSFLSNQDHLNFGSCIRSAVESSGRSAAIVASGDLSHRLRPDAPAGYNPEAHRFDEAIVEAIEGNTPQRIISVDTNLRRLAGECGYRSMLVGLGAMEHLPPACEVLSYEAPFGVGYLVAQLTNQKVGQTE